MLKGLSQLSWGPELLRGPGVLGFWGPGDPWAPKGPRTESHFSTMPLQRALSEGTQYSANDHGQIQKQQQQ